jgi:hypothetical protein
MMRIANQWLVFASKEDIFYEARRKFIENYLA